MKIKKGTGNVGEDNKRRIRDGLLLLSSPTFPVP
jgi:hypothetical protein